MTSAATAASLPNPNPRHRIVPPGKEWLPALVSLRVAVPDRNGRACRLGSLRQLLAEVLYTGAAVC